MEYTIQYDDSIDLIPEGTYRALLSVCEKRMGKTENFVHVEWEIAEPINLRGRKVSQLFNIYTENDEYREYAIKAFDKFCRQISGLEKGTKFEPQDYYLRQYDITVKHREKKSGDKYVRVTYIKQIPQGDVDHRSMVLPEKPSNKVSLNDLNDPMPF